MAITLSTDAAIVQRTNVYAERQMLKFTPPATVLDKFGLTKRMPQNKSTVISFRRPKVFSAVDTPLVEGVTPNTTNFEYEGVSATLRQYGQVVGMTDVIEMTHEDPVLQDATMQAGKNIGRTIEALSYAVLKGGSNVTYANGSARTDVNTPISLSKQRAVTRALKAQGAEKIRKMLSPAMEYETHGIEACYVGVAHTDLEADIRNMAGFVPVVNYGSRKPLCPEEIGTVEDVTYVLSRDLDPILAGGSGTLNGMVSQGSSAVDIYPVLYFGEEAYGCVGLRGMGAVSPTVIPTNERTKDDPLGQRGYVGWKTWFVCVRLNELWMQRLEVGVSEL